MPIPKVCKLHLLFVFCIDPFVCYDLIFTNLHLTMRLKSILDFCSEVLFLSSGFWVVSTSEDDVSELQSDEINPEEFELDKEKDINDLEVMNILSQIETLNGNDHIKNDVIIEDIESCESALSEKVGKFLNIYFFSHLICFLD